MRGRPEDGSSGEELFTVVETFFFFGSLTTISIVE
jgi:hypothetical protein